MWRVLLGICLFCHALSLHAQTPHVLKFGVTVDLVGDVRYGGGVLTAVYKELGWNVEFVRVPPERSLQDANSGLLDGESPHPLIPPKDAQNLLLINVPFVTLQHGAMTSQGRVVSNLESLRGKRIVIRQGDRLAELKVAGWPGLSRVKDFQVGVQMLLADHADAMIAFEPALKELASRKEYAHAGLTISPVFRTPVFHYLNRRHSALLPSVTRLFERYRGTAQTVLEGAHRSGFQPPEPLLGERL